MCDYASYQPCPSSVAKARSAAELFAEAEALKKKRYEKKSPGIEFLEEYLR